MIKNLINFQLEDRRGWLLEIPLNKKINENLWLKNPVMLTTPLKLKLIIHFNNRECDSLNLNRLKQNIEIEAKSALADVF